MIDFIPYIPIIMILAFIPYACYSDIRNRTVSIYHMLAISLLSIPSLLIYLSESPERNYYLFAVSIALCAVLLVTAMIGGIGGADFWFASIIMLFVQYNPFTFPREYFPMDFMWNLLIVMAFIPIPVFLYNKIHRNDKFDEVTNTKGYGVIEMFTRYPRGVPFIVPISIAFVSTLIMEVVL